jgi:hypothetical protein
MYPIEFEAFYLVYPRKVEKKNAFLTWKRLTIKQKKEVIVAAKNYAKAMRVECREFEYMKYPKSFISPTREIWREYLEPPKKASDVWLEKKLKEGK